jgi:ssDNA-binding Zn-finger/Zn-ribbon topoisomerase 1
MERHTILRERVKATVIGAPSLAHLLPEGGLVAGAERDAARLATRVSVAFSKGRAITLVIPDEDAPNVSALVWDGKVPGATPTRMVLPNPLPDKRGFISALEGLDGFEAAPPALTRAAWITAHGVVPRCPACAKHPMRLNPSPHGAFWGCAGHPACKGTIDTFPFDTGALKGSRALAPKCPSCARPMRKRDGERGAFWGCTGFPDCNRSLDGKLGDRGMTSVNDWLPPEGEPEARTPVPVDPLGGDAPPPPRGAGPPPRPSPAPSGVPVPAAAPEPSPAPSAPSVTVDDIRARFRPAS